MKKYGFLACVGLLAGCGQPDAGITENHIFYVLADAPLFTFQQALDIEGREYDPYHPTTQRDLQIPGTCGNYSENTYKLAYNGEKAAPQLDAEGRFTRKFAYNEHVVNWTKNFYKSSPPDGKVKDFADSLMGVEIEEISMEVMELAASADGYQAYEAYRNIVYYGRPVSISEQCEVTFGDAEVTMPYRVRFEDTGDTWRVTSKLLSSALIIEKDIQQDQLPYRQ